MKQQLIDAMRATFGTDQRRIEHALAVLEYAERILEEEPAADRLTVVAAALLHDIGIQEAERLYGSSAPPYQEELGPPIARSILMPLGIPGEVVEHACRIVGSHHSARDIDTVEFRIIWDADWLVNIPDEYGHLDSAQLLEMVAKVFRTQGGRNIARTTLLEAAGM